MLMLYSVGVRISLDALKLMLMEKIICPKCGSEITVDISKAIDENGEIFLCKSCVAIFVEIDKEIVVFRCSATQIFVARSPLAIF